MRTETKIVIVGIALLAIGVVYNLSQPATFANGQEAVKCPVCPECGKVILSGDWYDTDGNKILTKEQRDCLKDSTCASTVDNTIKTFNLSN